MADDERKDGPQDEQEQPTEAAEPTPEPPAEEPVPEAEAAEAAEEPAAEEPAAAEEEPAAAEEEPAAAEEEPSEEPTADAEAAGEPSADEEPTAAEKPEEERPKPKRSRKKDSAADEPEAIPGAHLEPDLVLEDDVRPGEASEIDEAEPAAESDEAEEAEVDEAEAPLATTILELAADARYSATGKRKSAVARVTIKPGNGDYRINGRTLDEYFPRPTLRRQARRPLEIVGQENQMDVVASIHGGGVSAQAGALRHGITRALVEADPNLRGELKRRGFLTRDPRVKERKKAGLKKARKRPQFSKR